MGSSEVYRNHSGPALSGRKAFGGETPTDTLARILEREPDWEKLPAGTFTAGKPRVLFEGDYDSGSYGDAHYDVSPDGKTFAMAETEEANPPTRVNVVLNWGEDLKRLAPVEGPTRR